MAQYPVTDVSAVVDSLNYVLSGPTGLGQDFAWFNSNGLTQYDLTGNYRAPFTQLSYNPPGVPGVSLYVAPLAIGTAEMLDGRTWKFTFAVTQSTPPFIPGQPCYVTGVADSWYDGYYSPIGVVECTVDYVILRSRDTYATVAPSSGGTVELNSMDGLLSTDLDVRVTVTAPTEVVVISSQLNNEIFADPGFVGNYTYKTYINRYAAVSNNVAANPEFIFNLEATVAYKEINIDTSTLSTSTQETIFTSIIDNPPPGYYRYIMEIEFNDVAGGNIITNCILTQRSISAQVVKP